MKLPAALIYLVAQGSLNHRTMWTEHSLVFHMSFHEHILQWLNFLTFLYFHDVKRMSVTELFLLFKCFWWLTDAVNHQQVCLIENCMVGWKNFLQWSREHGHINELLLPAFSNYNRRFSDCILHAISLRKKKFSNGKVKVRQGVPMC